MMNWAMKYPQISSENFAIVFQVGQNTCLISFTFCLLNKIIRSNDKQKIAQWFLLWGLSPKVLLCKTLVER
jgi:hypothetical protein